MLSAFNYSDVITNSTNLNDNTLWEKEKELINSKIEELLPRYQKKTELCNCPLCGNHGKFIFEKKGYSYYQCPECYSIFMPVTSDLLIEYRKGNDINKLRMSDEYQKNAYEERKMQWEELLDWLSFRTYRYLGRNEHLIIDDYNNRFEHFKSIIRNSKMCEKYQSLNSNEKQDVCYEEANLLLYMAGIQQTQDPKKELMRLRKEIKSGGLLFLSSRLGTGFDVLVLKEYLDRIFPFEHILLPSIKGLELVLQRVGFKVLEIVTPGNIDVISVLNNKDKIEQNDYFMRYMFNECNEKTYNEFQRFLQKNRLSSYVQIIAQKE